MRTTVSIDDHLLDRARALALETKRPLGDVVDDGLRVLFAKADEGDAVRASSGIELPVCGTPDGLMPGVDLDDKEALADLLDLSGDEYEARRARAAG